MTLCVVMRAGGQAGSELLTRPTDRLRTTLCFRACIPTAVLRRERRAACRDLRDRLTATRAAPRDRRCRRRELRCALASPAVIPHPGCRLASRRFRLRTNHHRYRPASRQCTALRPPPSRSHRQSSPGRRACLREPPSGNLGSRSTLGVRPHLQSSRPGGRRPPQRRISTGGSQSCGARLQLRRQARLRFGRTAAPAFAVGAGCNTRGPSSSPALSVKLSTTSRSWARQPVRKSGELGRAGADHAMTSATARPRRDSCTNRLSGDPAWPQRCAVFTYDERGAPAQEPGGAAARLHGHLPVDTEPRSVVPGF